MTNKIKEHDYQEAYDRLVNQKLFQDQSDTTSKVRSTGLKDFLSLGFPAKRKGNEEWKYTDIRPIMNDSFESPYEAKKVVNSKEDSLIKDAIESVLVDKENPTTSLIFVDGIYKIYHRCEWIYCNEHGFSRSRSIYTYTAKTKIRSADTSHIFVH